MKPLALISVFCYYSETGEDRTQAPCSGERTRVGARICMPTRRRDLMDFRWDRVCTCAHVDSLCRASRIAEFSRRRKFIAARARAALRHSRAESFNGRFEEYFALVMRRTILQKLAAASSTSVAVHANGRAKVMPLVRRVPPIEG